MANILSKERCLGGSLLLGQGTYVKESWKLFMKNKRKKIPTEPDLQKNLGEGGRGKQRKLKERPLSKAFI